MVPTARDDSKGGGKWPHKSIVLHPRGIACNRMVILGMAVRIDIINSNRSAGIRNHGDIGGLVGGKVRHKKAKHIIITGTHKLRILLRCKNIIERDHIGGRHEVKLKDGWVIDLIGEWYAQYILHASNIFQFTA